MTGDLNEAVQWQQVTCRDCGRSYQCTPEDDYYGPSGSRTGGQCFGCLLRANGLDPDATRVLAVDERGAEWDPRDLAVRENFEAARDQRDPP